MPGFWSAGIPGEEGFEGLEAPCRGADADDGNPGYGAFDRLLRLDRCLGDFRRVDGLGFGRLFSVQGCNPASEVLRLPEPVGQALLWRRPWIPYATDFCGARLPCRPGYGTRDSPFLGVRGWQLAARSFVTAEGTVGNLC